MYTITDWGLETSFEQVDATAKVLLAQPGIAVVSIQYSLLPNTGGQCMTEILTWVSHYGKIAVMGKGGMEDVSREVAIYMGILSGTAQLCGPAFYSLFGRENLLSWYPDRKNVHMHRVREWDGVEVPFEIGDPDA